MGNDNGAELAAGRTKYVEHVEQTGRRKLNHPELNRVGGSNRIERSGYDDALSRGMTKTDDVRGLRQARSGRHPGADRLSASESILDTGHDLREVRFGDRVIGTPSVLRHAQKTAPLHEPQMLGGHVAGDLAGFGQFAHGVTTAEQHLDDPQPVGVRERLQAFGGLA